MVPSRRRVAPLTRAKRTVPDLEVLARSSVGDVALATIFGEFQLNRMFVSVNPAGTGDGV